MKNKQLGHYQITDRIGAGGMGEVYRARDTKLGREVALKLLPPIFAQDPERLARFKREAKLLAALNHAHVATLHGLEEESGQHFLVMELVEGDDLAARVVNGPIPVNEALKIVRDVADALQAAHAQGIVHRDLKPANVKVTPDGGVKVLDFGLAKAFETDPVDPDITRSPTIGSAMGTAGGVILGTAAYMSPEQARGKPVDKLTDVWALGCLLYEMLSGAHAFPGETVSDTIAKILEREPDWSQIPADTPPPVQHMLRRCLEKDKSVRLQDVGEVRIEIDAALSGTSRMWSASGPVAELALARKRGGALGWVVGLLGVVAAAVFGALYFGSSPEPPSVVRSSIPAPPEARFVSMGDYAGPVVVSPDGDRVAFAANDAGLNRMLWVRDLDQTDARVIPGTNEASFPFWSPDGRSLGFFTDTKLMRVELSGGLPITLCDAPNGRGGTWGSAGTILFSSDFQVGLSTVPESGGRATAVTRLDSTKHSTHRWPEFMPDGDHFIYMAAHHDVSFSDNYGVYFASVSGSGEAKRVLDTATGAIFASGHILYVRESTLMAVPFDPVAGEQLGEPVTLIDKVQSDPTTWRAALSASRNGLLAYHGSSGDLPTTRLAIVDRSGREVEAVEDARVYYHLQLSPDGRRVACTSGTQTSNALGLDIWIYDVDRGLRTRLSFGDGADVAPVWSPDGTRIAFTTIYPGLGARESVMTVAQADGSGEEVILRDAEDIWITDWSDDGRYIVYSKGGFVSQDSEIWVLPLVGNREPFPFLQTEFIDDVGCLSPDGRWMAYATQEDLGNRIYVAPFTPPVEAGGDSNDTRAFSKWQVSAEGDVGSLPRWNPKGGELFFIKADGTIWSANVDTSGDTFRTGRVELVCKTDPWNFGRIGYDVTPDGNHFVVNSFSAVAAPPITLVQNWLEDLKKQ